MSGRKTLNIACLPFHFVPSSRYPLLQGHLYDPKILAQEALWWHRYPAYEHSFWSKHEKPLPWKPDLHLHIRPFPCKPSLHEHVYEPSLLLQVAVELQSPKPFRNSSTSWQTWPSSENLELQVLLRDPKVLRVIVWENRAGSKDGGRPISSKLIPFDRHQMEIRLVKYEH